MASDLAAIRAEGRRLLADFYAFGTEDDGFRRDRLIDFFYDHADALLADPAPSVPLVEAGAALPKCPAYSPSSAASLPPPRRGPMAEAVHIPSDPDERAALAEMAGLTADERRALDQWCHLMAIERAAQRRRALEQSSEWAMP